MPRPEPITLQVAAVCADCGVTIPAGAQAHWYTKSQKAYCVGGNHPQPSQQSGPVGPGPAPVPPPRSPQAVPEAPQWGFEQKDKIGLMQTCINVYGDMWTAALNVGSAPKVPGPTTIAMSARALWKEALEAIGGALVPAETLDDMPPDDEVPFE